ncbi:MAG: hypothetical protein K2O30_07295 [Duncaniella sp.]|nr:hypothetical protein [Duncaniella sp.]MDE7145938.1 hypothetical protein [Duncaniella sp.]
MKNLLVIIALYILTLLLVACDRKVEVLFDTLRRAEELMESHPDSALSLLEDSLLAENLRSADRQEMARYALLLTRVRHKNYIDEIDDSLITVATSYFSGSSDEHSSMLALYHSGIIKTNAGNYASAIITLLKAEELADQNNEYLWLGRIRLALAEVYNRAVLPEEEVKYASDAIAAFNESCDTIFSKYACEALIIALTNAGYSDAAIRELDIQYADAVAENDTIFIVASLDHYMYCYYKLKRNSEVINYFNRLKAFAPDKISHENYFMVISSLWDIGNHSEASALMDSVVSVFGDSIPLPSGVLSEMGKYEDAYRHLYKMTRLYEETFKGIITQNVASAVSDYNESELQERETALHTRTVQFAAALIIIIVLVTFVMYIIYVHRREQRQKTEEIMDIAEELKKAINSNSENENQINALKLSRFETIKILCETYHDSAQRDSAKNKIANEAMQIINSIAADESLFSDFENIVNRTHDNIVEKFREQMSDLDEVDYRLFICSAMRLSVPVCYLILRLNRNTFYSRRLRLKKKIIEENPLDSYRFLKEFEY